ncbi:MAG: glycosyltransferase [Bacteroidetes bacterium]|nr:glycosyltransferase [Bacteroidota bacterium]
MEPREIFMVIFLLPAVCYGAIIGLFTFGLIRILKHARLESYGPSGFVSVIIPVRNEAGNILRILDEMLRQDFPGTGMEVIIADDFSEDDTMNLARGFAASHPGFPLVLADSPHSGAGATGKKRAIERAVAQAKGDILLFTDADTARGTGWISSMVSGFRQAGIRMVLGPVCFSNEKNMLQKIQSLEFMGLMGVTAGSAALGFPVMCNGANLAYRREAFLQSGGFSGNLKYLSGDDQFIMASIRKHYGKGSLLFNAAGSTVVSTGAEATLKGFFNQRIRWVSKSRGYRDPFVVAVGAVTYLTHLILLAGILTGFFIPGLPGFFLLAWLAKIILEFPMVWIMGRFFGKRDLWVYYPAAQVFQLVYVPLAGVLGLLLPYRWKGRKG